MEGKYNTRSPGKVTFPFKIDKIVLIAASEIPRILKVASLQLTGMLLLRDSSNFDLFKISDDPFVQDDSSSNILFSIPK